MEILELIFNLNKKISLTKKEIINLIKENMTKKDNEMEIIYEDVVREQISADEVEFIKELILGGDVEILRKDVTSIALFLASPAVQHEISDIILGNSLDMVNFLTKRRILDPRSQDILMAIKTVVRQDRTDMIDCLRGAGLKLTRKPQRANQEPESEEKKETGDNPGIQVRSVEKVDGSKNDLGRK